MIAQSEDPAKLLHMDEKKRIDGYLNGKGWKPDAVREDEVKETYYLYKKKTTGGGIAYIALWPEKFMHYQVFFADKHNYSTVLSYDDFLNMPKGKSRFNRSQENKTYAIKSITFDDPHDTRNQNMFYGLLSMDHESLDDVKFLTEEEEKERDLLLQLEEQEENYQMYMEDEKERMEEAEQKHNSPKKK